MRDNIVAQSEQYDEIIKDWLKKKPMCEKNIKRYTEQITALKNEIEEIVMERINDREHAEVYNSMIAKREAEIADCEQKILDNKQYDEVSRKRRDELKSTFEILSDIITEGKISDANLRMLVNGVKVYNDEDGGLDVMIEFNGGYELSR